MERLIVICLQGDNTIDNIYITDIDIDIVLWSGKYKFVCHTLAHDIETNTGVALWSGNSSLFAIF